MLEVPPVGGDTLFASMYAAYEALSPPMQRFLEDLTAMHEGEHVYRGRCRVLGQPLRPAPRAVGLLSAATARTSRDDPGRQALLPALRVGTMGLLDGKVAAVDGRAPSSAAAQAVVTEIEALGGRAVANAGSVATMTGGESIVDAALGRFGDLHIVVCCAGILRERMIFNMTEEEWDAPHHLHLHLHGRARGEPGAAELLGGQGGHRRPDALDGAGDGEVRRHRPTTAELRRRRRRRRWLPS